MTHAPLKVSGFTRAHCEVLAKPFDLDAIVDTVRAMLPGHDSAEAAA
jgi:DNA-binding response OmpR family regulator